MKRIIATVVMLVLFVQSFPVFMPIACATENVIFQDSFESYAVGTFPSSGGWDKVWYGAGDLYQVVTDAYNNSPAQSFQLMGSYGWSVVVKKDFSSTSDVIGYEVYMMATEGGGGDIAFCNIALETWGRYYAMVAFCEDGNISACERNNNATHVLQPYTPNNWYKIRAVVDRTTWRFSVWVDDVLRGPNIPMYNDPHEIVSLQFQVGWVNNKAYFDDVKVFDVPLVTASTDFDPNTLNLESKDNWITCYVELPQGYNVNGINASTMLLNGTIPVGSEAPPAIGDYDGDGVADLTVEFNRTEVSSLVLGQGIAAGNVTLTITGQLHDGTPFEGSTVIAVRMPGDLNMDREVDIKDIVLAASAFGSNPQNPRWNPVADENEDGIIDVRDMALVAKNFGKTYS